MAVSGGVVALAARAPVRRHRARRARAGPQHLSGVTPPAVALAASAAAARRSPVAGRRAGRPRHRSADRRHPLLRLDARRLERGARRARRAAVPVARDRSVSRDRAAPRRDVGPRPGAARAGDRVGARRRDVGRGDRRRASAASSGCATPRVVLQSGRRRRPGDARRIGSSTPASPAPIRSISTASSASAAASSTSSRRARRSRSASSSSATPSRRCAATTRRRSARSRPIDQVLLLPLRDVLPEAGGGGAQGADDVGVETVDRGGTILDYAAEAGARLFVVEHGDVVEHGEALDASLAASYAEATRRGRRVLRARGDRGAVERAGGGAGGGDPARSAGRRHRRSRRSATIACQSVSRHHGRVDQWVARAAQGARGRRDHAVRRRIGRPRRAHHRAAARVRRAGAAGRRRRGDARRPWCWSRPARSPPVSAWPTPSCTLVAESDVFDDERVRRDRASAAGGPSAGTRRTLLLRLPRPEGRRSRRPRRSRHRPCSSA